MKAQYTHTFLKDYKKMPSVIQKAFEGKLDFLLKNTNHPSLRVKKIQGTSGRIWEASITMNYRLTFQMTEDTVLLRRMGTHDILKRP